VVIIERQRKEHAIVSSWTQKWTVVEAFEQRKQYKDAQAKIIQTEIKNGSELVGKDVIEVTVTNGTESQRAVERLESRRKEQGKPDPAKTPIRTRQVRYFCSPDTIDTRRKVQAPTR
jgi:hypothetical protein